MQSQLFLFGVERERERCKSRKEGMNDKIYYLEQEKQTMMTDDKKVSQFENEILI